MELYSQNIWGGRRLDGNKEAIYIHCEHPLFNRGGGSSVISCFEVFQSPLTHCLVWPQYDGRVQVNDPFFHTLAHVLTNTINPRPPGPPPKEQSLLPKYLNLHQLFTNWRNLLDERRDVIMKLTAAFFLNSQYYRCNVTRGKTLTCESFLLLPQLHSFTGKSSAAAKKRTWKSFPPTFSFAFIRMYSIILFHPCAL